MKFFIFQLRVSSLKVEKEKLKPWVIKSNFNLIFYEVESLTQNKNLWVCEFCNSRISNPICLNLKDLIFGPSLVLSGALWCIRTFFRNWAVTLWLYNLMQKIKLNWQAIFEILYCKQANGQRDRKSNRAKYLGHIG